MRGAAYFLASLMVLMLATPFVTATPLSVGSSVEVVVGSSPNGISGDLSLAIPEGKVVKGVDLSIAANTWPVSSAFSWDKSTDYDNPSASYSGVEVNGSELTLLNTDPTVIGTVGGWSGSQSAITPVVLSGGEMSLIYNCVSWCSETSIQYKVPGGSWTTWKTTNSMSNNQVYRSSTQTPPLLFTAIGTYEFQVFDSFGDGPNGGNLQMEQILPAGVGTWTSPAFGPGSGNQFQSKIDRYGMMSIDVIIPTGSMFLWDITDTVSGDIIPGLQGRDDTILDLGLIDWQQYPSVKLMITLEASDKGAPMIYGIHLQGAIFHGFHEDPTTDGWTRSGSIWSGGKITGNSGQSLTTPIWHISTPFSRVSPVLDYTGSGKLEVSFDGGSWIEIVDGKSHSLQASATELQFKWTGSSNWALDSFSIEIDTDSPPINPHIDIGTDGVQEWTLSHEDIDSWGFQSGFKNGDAAVLFDLQGSTKQHSDLLLPRDGMKYFSFAVAAEDGAVNGVTVDIVLEGLNVVSKNIGTVFSGQTITLTPSELSTLKSALSSANSELELGGFSFTTTEITVGSSGGLLQISAINAPWSASTSFQADYSHPLTRSINSAISSSPTVSGEKIVTLPISMAKEGSLTVSLDGILFASSPQAGELLVYNATDTLSASDELIEFVSTFDLVELGVNDVISHMSGNNWGVRLDLDGSNVQQSISCQIQEPMQISSCQIGELLDVSSIEIENQGNLVRFTHRLRVDASWADEHSLRASVSLEMEDSSSLPAEYLFGAGSAMGLEQDIEVVDWWILSETGIRSSWDSPYVEPGMEPTLQVQLRFENLSESSPRSFDVMATVSDDGQEIAVNSTVVDGIISLPISVSSIADQMEISVVVSGLKGQDIIWLVEDNLIFETDGLAPVLISSSVSKLDHHLPAEDMDISFTVADRPTLPRHAKAMILSSWTGQIQTLDMQLPSDLSQLQGDYHLHVDLAGSAEGDLIQGWIEIADTAGLVMEGGGSESDPMFTVKLAEDGAPSILQEDISWLDGNHLWLHPSTEYTLSIPIVESNGHGDLERVVVELETSGGDSSTLTWDPNAGTCVSSDFLITLNECGPRVGLGDFDTNVIIDFTIELDWGFSGDPSVVRSMIVSAFDDSGQSSRVIPKHMDWRFSSEVSVDLNSVTLANSSYWVRPLQENTVHGSLIWHRDKSPVLEDIEIEIEIDNTQFIGNSSEGNILVNFQTPSDSGVHSLTIKASDLPTGGLDRTDDSVVAAWVIVDSNPPEVNGLISPQSDEIISEWMWNNLSIEISVAEEEGLDMDSMVMRWVVVPAGISFHSLAVASGNASLELLAGNAQGSTIPLHAIINLEEIIPIDLRVSALDLRVWVEGTDLAGQNMSRVFNNEDTPLGVLRLANREVDIRFSKDDISFSTDEPMINVPIEINIMANNEGLADGKIRIRIESVQAGGSREAIKIIDVFVGAGGSTNASIQWTPMESGTVWFELSLPDGTSIRTDSVQINEGEVSMVVSSFDSANNIALSAVAIIAIILILLLVTLWRKPIEPSETEGGIDGYNTEYNDENIS